MVSAALVPVLYRQWIPFLWLKNLYVIVASELNIVPTTEPWSSFFYVKQDLDVLMERFRSIMIWVTLKTAVL